MLNIVPRPPRKYGTDANAPAANQVERLFAKFGGASHLKKALDAVGKPRCISALYRWNMDRPAGSGGRVPTQAWPDVMKAARLFGIVVTAEDMMPNVD